jgi:hypothetical protein
MSRKLKLKMIEAKRPGGREAGKLGGQKAEKPDRVASDQ